MRARVDFSLAEARRIALAAQGLAGSPSPRTSRAALLKTVDQLGVLQIDAVNVLARAHYMPLFSRHGAYEEEHLEEAAYGRSRTLFEYWGHQASLLPTALHPLFRWRMERAAKLEGIYGGLASFVREHRKLVEAVLDEVRVRGPLGAGDLAAAAPRKGGWWGWSDGKRALEYLFWAGELTTSTRKNFERIYDLTARALPPDVLGTPTPSVDDAQRELVRISARALGIATDDDIADYFRLRLGVVRPRIAELVEAGVLSSVRVESFDKPTYLFEGTRLPRATTGAAILSPFDPLVWYRARAERLFDFHYRIEIYTPAHKRQHGYYVLPFLLGDALVARIDLKAAREESVLKVQAAHLERGARADVVVSALATQLRVMADWLGLERIVVARKGALASKLARHILVRSPLVRAGET